MKDLFLITISGTGAISNGHLHSIFLNVEWAEWKLYVRRGILSFFWIRWFSWTARNERVGIDIFGRRKIRRNWKVIHIPKLILRWNTALNHRGSNSWFIASRNLTSTFVLCTKFIFRRFSFSCIIWSQGVRGNTSVNPLSRSVFLFRIPFGSMLI